MAYGVLPALLDKATTGQLVKQAQQHLVQFTLQPVAELIATEASEKLASPVSLDVMTGTQAFDTGAAARSFQMLIAGLAAAKEAGIDAKAALAMLDWSSNEI
jgi:phage portal protein BeeE